MQYYLSRARVLQGGFTLSYPPEPILRPQSSVSATSFAKVAAGDEQCFFRSWLKSNYRYEPLPSDFDRDGWATAHNLMLHKTKSELEQKGYTVFTENQNAFDAVGKTGAKFSGRADIVAVQGDTALIVDCKTGQYKAFHALQVRLYMYMLEHHQPDHPAHSCKTFLGQVLYQSGAANELPPLATEEAGDLPPELLHRARLSQHRYWDDRTGLPFEHPILIRTELFAIGGKRLREAATTLLHEVILPISERS